MLKLFLIFLLFLSGCASLRGTSQRLKLYSTPSEVDVLENDRFIGKTPGFLQVPRRKNINLTFSRLGYETFNVNLKGSYRWGDSFLANLVWLVGAPVAWGIDLLTGAAFEYEKVPEVSLLGEQKGKSEKMPRLIAVAPPQIDYELLSDEIGSKLPKELSRQFPDDRFLPYDESLGKFNSYSYTNVDAISPDYSDDLFYELKASHVLESTVRKENQDYVVSSKLKNVYSEKIEKETETRIPSAQLKKSQSGQGIQKILSLISLAPNTLTFDFATPDIDIQARPADGGPSYYARANRDNPFINIATGIGFRKVKNPLLMKNFVPTFSFVPDFSLRYQRFFFERNEGRNDLINLGYNKYSLNLGLGPEMGLESPVGYFYLHWIPSFGPSYLTWQQNGENLDSFRFLPSNRTELGYMFFVAKSVVVRLYTKTTSGSGSQWDGVLTRSAGGDIQVSDTFEKVAGISVGYYFSTSRLTVKNWFR